MNFAQLNEGPCDVATKDDIRKMNADQYAAYAQWKKECEAEERQKNESEEGFTDKQIKMAFGILNDPRYKQGNYSGAHAAIESIAKGLASHPSVANALRRANESFDEKVSPYFTKKESVKNENIYKKNLEDPMNPEVLVQGWGRLDLKSLETKVVRMFHEIAEMGEKGNWENVEYNLNKGLVQAFIKAINETYEELEQIRKRGGTNSRGIKQR